MKDRHTTGNRDEPQADSHRTSHHISRRTFLRRASVLTSVGAGLLAGCGAPEATAPAAPTAAAPTVAPTEAAAAVAPTIAPTEAAAATMAPAVTEAAAATTAAATTAPATTAGGGAITWAMENDPVQMLPFGSITTESFRARQMIYDSLVAWDKDLNVQPALAESYETPDDKTWIWHLRQGVKFHNGKEVDADDVKYSMDLQAAPPEPGIPSPFYPKTLTSVEVVDKYTIKFNMSGPDPTVLGYLAWGRYSPIVPKGLYDQVNVLTEGIGTGPFKLVEFVSNDRVVYTRNPDFWNPDLPHFDDMTLKVLPDESARVAALRSGAVHGCTVSADTAASLSNDPDIEILSGLFAAPRVLQFTIKDATKPWSKKQVRQAMSKAIDRQLIIDNVYAGEAALTGPISPGYGDWPLPDADLANTWYKYDPDAARQLLADAGHADGFEITLYSLPDDLARIAEIVKEQLRELNITVNVVVEELGTFAKRNGEGDFDWCLTARGMRGDPTGFVVDFGRPNVSAAAKWFNNGDGWKNQEIIDNFEAAAINLDSVSRHAQIKKIQELVIDEAPHIYLVQSKKFHAVRKELKDMYVDYTDFLTGLRNTARLEA